MPDWDRGIVRKVEKRRRLLQVPDVVIHFSAYNAAARVESGNRYKSPFIHLTAVIGMKEIAVFEGRSER